MTTGGGSLDGGAVPDNLKVPVMKWGFPQIVGSV